MRKLFSYIKSLIKPPKTSDVFRQVKEKIWDGKSICDLEKTNEYICIVIGRHLDYKLSRERRRALQKIVTDSIDGEISVIVYYLRKNSHSYYGHSNEDFQKLRKEHLDMLIAKYEAMGD